MTRIEHEKDEQTASIVHEIKKPLANITMLADVLLDDMDTPYSEERDSDIRSNLKQIVEQGQLCSRLLEKMKQSKENAAFQFDSIELNMVLGKALDDLNRRQDRETVTIEQNLQANLTKLKADEDAIYQLFNNLFNNAFDAMKESREKVLTVSNCSTDSGISIEIEDTGCGMSRDESSRIFDSFFTTKGENGMGMGLSICKNIVEAHNGSINVESEPQGGSQFRIFLPYQQAKA